jgi:hypothetical protein
MNEFDKYFQILIQQKPYDLSTKTYINPSYMNYENCTEGHFPPELRSQFYSLRLQNSKCPPKEFKFELKTNSTFI